MDMARVVHQLLAGGAIQTRFFPLIGRKNKPHMTKLAFLGCQTEAVGNAVGDLWLSLSWQCVTPSLEGLECGFPASHEVGGL